MQTKFISNLIAKGAGLGPRQIRVRASDATQDRVGDVMDVSGCDLTSFRENPIVLFSHDPAHPIGRASLGVSGYALEGVVTFAPEGASRKADEVCALAKSGVLSGVSVGFEPIETKPIPGGGYRVTKWALLELSIVAVPANPSATILERSYRPGRAPVALSRAARAADIAALRAAAPVESPQMSQQQLFLAHEIQRVLSMSAALYENDPETRRKQRARDMQRLSR